MARELAYAIITPYSLLKSRTGGIIGRLIAMSGLELVGARMYRPSDAMIDALSKSLGGEDMPSHIRSALLDYIDKNLRPDNACGIVNRCMFLLFSGEDAVSRLRHDAVGSITEDVRGDTIRGTYGDLVLGEGGEVRYFEPAVICSGDPEASKKQLEVFAQFAASDGGVLEKAIPFPPGLNVETGLVILKPDNFTRASTHPGLIVDIFSRTGLYIVGAKLLRLNLEQGEQFYGHLYNVFVKKFRPRVEVRAKEALASAFDFTVPPAKLDPMIDSLSELNARHELNRIVTYMTGYNPERTAAEQPEAGARCLGLLYRGENAIAKIRERLGPTNPTEASPGTVRGEIGHDIMKNAAHASDSVSNAEKERRIVGMWEDDGADIREAVERYLKNS